MYIKRVSRYKRAMENRFYALPSNQHFTIKLNSYNDHRIIKSIPERFSYFRLIVSFKAPPPLREAQKVKMVDGVKL